MRMPDQPNQSCAELSGVSLAVALRLATAKAHEAVEQLPIMLRLTSDAVTVDDYRRYLQILAGIYAAVEAALYSGLDADLRQRLGVRPKLPALLRDLEEQGMGAASARVEGQVSPDGPDGFAPRGTSAIIGGLYVLEGATLGGRTIARHLRRCLGAELGAASLLDFHGERTSAVWKRFSGALDELRAEGVLVPEEVIAGALATFDDIHHRLEQAGASR